MPPSDFDMNLQCIIVNEDERPFSAWSKMIAEAMVREYADVRLFCEELGDSGTVVYGVCVRGFIKKQVKLMHYELQRNGDCLKLAQNIRTALNMSGARLMKSGSHNYEKRGPRDCGNTRKRKRSYSKCLLSDDGVDGLVV